MVKGTLLPKRIPPDCFQVPKFTRSLAEHSGVPLRVRVWSFGLHATLAMEPENLWADVLSATGVWEISVETFWPGNWVWKPYFSQAFFLQEI